SDQRPGLCHGRRTLGLCPRDGASATARTHCRGPGGGRLPGSGKSLDQGVFLIEGAERGNWSDQRGRAFALASHFQSAEGGSSLPVAKSRRIPRRRSDPLGQSEGGSVPGAPPDRQAAVERKVKGV